jgi:hypothetical protein
MDVQELLERDIPLRTEIAPDWDEVVARARPRARTAPRVAAGLALAAALAAAAFAAAALWPGGGSVLERALAAVGDGPVIHVVLRSDVHPELVDLRTGAAQPLWLDEEEWYEPGVGLRRVDRFDGRVLSTSVVGPQELTRQQRQAYSGILDGYRDALAGGDAHVAGTDTIAGHDVYWIGFTPTQLPDVADGRDHAFAVQVAVDRTTYRPVYLRFTRDGAPGPGTGTRILSLDTVAAGSVDLTPQQPRATLRVLGTHEVHDVTADAAAVAPLWPGPTLEGLPLAFARTVAYEYGPADDRHDAAGFELCYGATAPGPGQVCDPQDGVFLQEAADPAALVTGPQLRIPDGSLLEGWGPGDVVHVGGVYVRIAGGDPRAAARALYEAKTSR